VCFSPQADVATGIVVGAIGVDAFRHLRGRNDHLLLAALPLLLGGHQLVEAFIWWGLEGHVPHTVGRVALWIYLLIAFVVLPIFVPVAVIALEPTRHRRLQLAPFVALGTGISAVMLAVMLRAPINAVERPYHISYSSSVSHGGLIVALYVVAVCGALLFSGYRNVEIFGFANLVAIVILAWLTLDGVASLWCGYAAVSAGAIALHMRYTKPRQTTPYLLS
jgi:energy-converting hydrogenase Eha subunit A